MTGDSPVPIYILFQVGVEVSDWYTRCIVVVGMVVSREREVEKMQEVWEWDGECV